MDSRLELVRHPAEQSSRPLVAGGNRQKPSGGSTQPAPTVPPPAKVGFAATEDQVSIDPLRATDRYRLVVPYSLRV